MWWTRVSLNLNSSGEFRSGKKDELNSRLESFGFGLQTFWSTCLALLVVNGKKNVQWPAFYCRFPSEVEKHNTVKVQNDTHWVSHNSTIPSTYCCSAIQSIHMFFIHIVGIGYLHLTSLTDWSIHQFINLSIYSKLQPTTHFLSICLQCFLVSVRFMHQHTELWKTGVTFLLHVLTLGRWGWFWF